MTDLNMLLSCFREKMSDREHDWILPDGLVPLRLPDLWLLVALGEDVGERGADDGALELLRLLRPLLGSLLLNALAVLPAIEIQ